MCLWNAAVSVYLRGLGVPRPHGSLVAIAPPDGMDVHHVGQFLDTPFAESVAF
jgi:hypothetical protein